MHMPQPNLKTKAEKLLARRAAGNSPWHYVTCTLRRQVFFLVGYIVLPIALWYLDLRMLAVAAAGFFLGTKLRDVRWWMALSKEWPTTMQLLDWPKIKSVAAGVSDDET